MKRYQVYWTAEALADLQSIFDFLAKRSEQFARKQINRIIDREGQLETHPESGTAQQAATPHFNYRFLVEGDYKIIYHIEQTDVFIDVVFPTLSDPANLQL